MNLEERAEQAAYYKKSGMCNCCQAVIAVLRDQTVLSEEQAFALGSGFGAGMGTMEASCGALIGAAMIAGLKLNGNGAQRAARQMAVSFKQACGAVTCRELKGVGTGRVLCSCEDCVRNAVRLCGEQLNLE